MSKPLTVPRRQETYDVIRDRIMSGALVPGARIIESTLCEELGVSRTPMREALFRLEQDGLVRQEPARGFSVMPLSAKEVRQIYPIIWTLEVLALKIGADNVDTTELQRLNRSLTRATNPEKQHALDDKWHEILIESCKNKRLLQQIQLLKHVAHRYELAYMRHSKKLDTSIDEHEAILTAIASGQATEAQLLLEKHWRRGMETVLDWLDWRDE